MIQLFFSHSNAVLCVCLSVWQRCVGSQSQWCTSDGAHSRACSCCRHVSHSVSCCEALGQATWHLFECTGLSWWRELGHLGRPHLPIVSKRVALHIGDQVLSDFSPLGVAESNSPRSNHLPSPFGVSGVESKAESSGSNASNADHNASVSSLQLVVQRLSNIVAHHQKRVCACSIQDARNRDKENTVGRTIPTVFSI